MVAWVDNGLGSGSEGNLTFLAMSTRLLSQPSIDDATRRGFLTGLTAVGLLVACGADGDAQPFASEVPTTNRVDSVLGPVDIPSDPRRVVAIEGRQDLDHVLALGLPLVGYPANRTFGDNVVSPYLAEALAAQQQAAPLYDLGALNVEAIAAARPDLICARVIEAEEFATEFAAIAPVLPFPFDVAWQEVAEQLARGVGRLERYEQLLATYADAVRLVSADRQDVLDAHVLCFQFELDGGVYVYGPGSFQHTIITEVGGRLAPLAAEAPADGLTFAPEELGRVLDGVDGAIVVVNTPDEVAALEANPLWSGSDLARAGRFVTADFYSNGGGPLTALGVTALVDDLYAALQR